ncbi:MAG: hypothetical protein M1484_02130 [Patescibacteria group bacterium]|nr:hypothetical protein [Patescibacteria group bacterium]MCL5431879.1 hypothetical protein [Patescibacteria group bacterium]
MRQIVLTPQDNDVTVLANEQLVALHQKDFEEAGLTFFPNWRQSPEYRQLLREGLRQKLLTEKTELIFALKIPSSEPPSAPNFFAA